jgi:hypothetical protein
VDSILVSQLDSFTSGTLKFVGDGVNVIDINNETVPTVSGYFVGVGTD